MMKRLKNNKGVVMITAYIFLSVIITLAASFAISAVNELSNARRFYDSKKSFWIAEAGIQKVMQLLKSGTTYASTTDINENYSTGSYAITIVPSGNIYTITSAGTSNNLTRRLRQTVQTGSSWPSAFNYAIFGNGGLMTIKEDGVVEGSVFQYGNVIIKADSSISEYVYASGSITAQAGASYTQGTIPDPAPAFPVLNTSVYFDPQIAQADASGISGDQVYNSIDLTGGTVYVDGNVQLNAGGTITGPGTLVAKGNVLIKENSVLGSGVEIISGGSLDLKENATIGSGFVLYGTTSVLVKEDGVGTPSGMVLTPGNVQLKQDADFTGIIYAGGTVEIKEDAVIRGSVVGGATSGDTLMIKEGAYITYDASILPATIPPGFASGGGGGLTVINWEEI